MQQQEEYFSRLHRLGEANEMIDFLDQVAKEGLDQYASLLAMAARYQCVIDFHGAKVTAFASCPAQAEDRGARTLSETLNERLLFYP